MDRVSVAEGARGFYNVNVVAAAGGEAGPQQAVSFLANFNTDSLAWSPDGTFLTFATGQRTEPGQVARVDLVLRTPKFREDRFRSLVRTGNAEAETRAGAASAPPAAAAATPRRSGAGRIVFDEPSPAAERRSRSASTSRIKPSAPTASCCWSPRSPPARPISTPIRSTSWRVSPRWRVS